MKQLLNRLVCLVKGHGLYMDDAYYYMKVLYDKKPNCSRCGDVLKSWRELNPSKRKIKKVAL